MQTLKSHLPGFIAITLLSTSIGQAQRSDAESVKLTTPRGVALAGTYWQAEDGKESPALVLLHGEGGNQKKWKAIAGGLQKAGYGVLTVDLRKHGESPGAAPAGAGSDSKGSSRSSSKDSKLKPTDYLAMISDDMEAVKVFLLERHHAGELNIRKTGFVAIGAVGAVAVNAAALDWARKPYPDGPPSARTPRGQDVRSIVLISPDASVKGVKTNNAYKMTKAGGVSFMVVVGTKDKNKKKSAAKIVKVLKAGLKSDIADERVQLQEFPVRNNGEDLVARDNAFILRLLAGFHDEKLKAINEPWRDRHSKLDK